MRLLALIPVLWLALSPAHAWAIDDTDRAEACLISAESDLDKRRKCIGSLSRTCINSTEVNQTTGGMSSCAIDERDAWRALNARYIARLRERESPTQIALLDAYIEQHTRWSQARCSYMASYYEGGSMARYLAAACARDSAGELALELHARLHDEGI